MKKTTETTEFVSDISTDRVKAALREFHLSGHRQPEPLDYAKLLCEHAGKLTSLLKNEPAAFLALADNEEFHFLLSQAARELSILSDVLELCCTHPFE